MILSAGIARRILARGTKTKPSIEPSLGFSLGSIPRGLQAARDHFFRIVDAHRARVYNLRMRRTLLPLTLAILIGGIQGCAGHGKGAASHVASYAKSVGKCVAERIAECAAPPLDLWCPDCQRLIDGAKRED